MKSLKLIAAGIITAGLLSQQIAVAQTSSSEPYSGSYNTAIGLRAGGTSGLTFKSFMTSNTAFEGIIAVWPHAFGFTGLHEWYAPAFNATGLNWYYGVGAHATLGIDRGYYVYTDDNYRYRSGSLGIGLDGILGLEYKIPSAPFAFSLDMKPYIEGNTYGGAYISLDPGLGIKVAF